MRALATALLLALPFAVPGPGAAQTWPEIKCSRYRQAWSNLLAHRGRNGLGPAFLGANEAFMASGCTEGGAVCPRSAAEIDVANTMTVLAMNFGTTDTFLPFGCRALPPTPPP